MRTRTRSFIRRTPHARPMFSGLRQFDRKDTKIDVFILDEEGWEIPFDCINISRSGLFVESSFLYNMGEVHTLVLFEGSRCVRLQGRVVRVEANNGLPCQSGMAYKFMRTDSTTFETLSQMVEAI